MYYLIFCDFVKYNKNMENQIHSELIIKEEEEEEEEKEQKCETKNIVCDGESTIGIRPRPLICKPENVNIGCKSEPIETKWHWAPGAWQDATRTSAFQPYKVYIIFYIYYLKYLSKIYI